MSETHFTACLNTALGELKMAQWFYEPENLFSLWGPAHLFTIAIAILCTSALFIFRTSLVPYRKPIRLTAGWTLLVSRASLDIWYIYTGQWDMRFALPLELSSIATIMCGMMLLTKSKFLFELFYFIAIGASVQAIVTPYLMFGFPQFRYMQFFLVHILLIMAPLIMISLYRFSVTFFSVIKSFVALNIIAAIVFYLDVLFNANYMFLHYKPSTASMLDVLGPYPYYLLSLEAVAFGMFIILYVPFALRKNNRVGD